MGDGAFKLYTVICNYTINSLSFFVTK